MNKIFLFVIAFITFSYMLILNNSAWSQQQSFLITSTRGTFDLHNGEMRQEIDYKKNYFQNINMLSIC